MTTKRQQSLINQIIIDKNVIIILRKEVFMKTIKDFDLKGKTVIIRADLNVPIENFFIDR